MNGCDKKLGRAQTARRKKMEGKKKKKTNELVSNGNDATSEAPRAGRW